MQLYRALVSDVSSPLQAALLVDAPNDGVGGLQYLRARYGARCSVDGQRDEEKRREVARQGASEEEGMKKVSTNEGGRGGGKAG